MMANLNSTNGSRASFRLIGIPGSRAAHVWISVPLCVMYIVTLLGNSALLFIIKTEESLHKPMYIFLCMLAVTELGLSICTLPTVLGIFWFELRQVPENACLLQMFFVHACSVMESSVLLAMAFDRFVAVCIPLRYSSILTTKLTTTIGAMIVIRGTVILLPIPVLVKKSPNCATRALSHPFCLHPDVLKMCVGNPANSIYSLFAILSTMGLDAVCIILSYAMILWTVFGLASKAERLKSFNACATHISVVFLFYAPMIAVSMVHRYGHHVAPPALQIILSFMHFLVPPAINPIIYGIKMKQIQTKIFKKVNSKKMQYK